MAKEWILNSAVNRFQLNFSRNVGKVSEEIRKCNPSDIEEWRAYYFKNVRPKTHIEELGRKLYIKISEVLRAEMDKITEEDCIEYMIKLVIDRTFEGYIREKKTIYEYLEQELNVKINPASDQWDRLYNIDFYIQVKNFYIGIQIKPVNKNIPLSEIHKEYSLQEKTHLHFTQKFGGKVFYVYSTKEGDKKKIVNEDVVKQIRDEIQRLNNL